MLFAGPWASRARRYGKCKMMIPGKQTFYKRGFAGTGWSSNDNDLTFCQDK